MADSKAPGLFWRIGCRSLSGDPGRNAKHHFRELTEIMDRHVALFSVKLIAFEEAVAGGVESVVGHQPSMSVAPLPRQGAPDAPFA